MRRKLATLVALSTTACTSWHVQSGVTPTTLQSVADAAGDSPLRLSLRSGAVADVYEARIVGDSIVGMSGPAKAAERQRVAYATAEVESVAREQVSVGKTVLALAAISLAALIIVGASGSGSSNNSCNSTSMASSPVVYVA